MTSRFFLPYVGRHYGEGIHGRRVLVVGASFYCANPSCQYFAQCTNLESKDSSPFDDLCPFYVAHGKHLHLEPSYCVDEQPHTYRKFGDALTSLFGVSTSEEVWEHLAFTNYCQFFLPAEGSFRPTYASDLTDRDFAAFMETCVDLQPDVIVVWGATINRPLLHNNPFVTDKASLDKTGGYVCHMQPPGVPHPISLVNCHHPSSRAWWGGQEEFVEYLEREIK